MTPPSSARPEGPTPFSALTAQNFDVFQRMATIVALCDHLARRGCATAADVGGFPGLLADHLPAGLRCRAIVDLPLCRRADHVVGSALAVPLRDGAVDVAVCADTLEHVGDPVAACRELARVARRAVVITAPWRREATEQAEKMLDRWHRQLTGCAHPWLTEHRQFGLPARSEIGDALREAGLTTAEFACGDLAEWTLLQISMLLQDLLPAEHIDFQQFNARYNSRWAVRLTSQLPASPYRTLLVAVREPSLVAELLEGESDPPAPAPLSEGLALIDGFLTTVQEILSTAGGEREGFDAAYRDRLETLTAQQAEEIERLRAEVNELRGRGAGGLRGLARSAVHRIRGREGER